tara:strand:+ start:3817 stop:3936 length:120 start_codon:yes stop_codon:yes gene_type:complete
MYKSLPNTYRTCEVEGNNKNIKKGIINNILEGIELYIFL